MCGNVSDLGCLVFQNPCQGLASSERQRLASFPAILSHPWHTPSDACSRHDLDFRAGTSRAQCFLGFFFSFFLLCVFSSLLKSCSAIKLKKCSKCLCQNVCPCSQWQQLNCWLIGGHTTWGTVSFLWQMEGPWSRRRPTAGSLEQMFCRQCKACVSSCQTPCSLMQRGAESPALQISRRNLPPELVYQLLTIQPRRT
jgi:hypothetical protein